MRYDQRSITIILHYYIFKSFVIQLFWLRYLIIKLSIFIVSVLYCTIVITICIVENGNFSFSRQSHDSSTDIQYFITFWSNSNKWIFFTMTTYSWIVDTQTNRFRIKGYGNNSFAGVFSGGGGGIEGEFSPKNSKFPSTPKKAKFFGGEEHSPPQIRFVINISNQFDFFFLILHDSYCNC